jgi:hypothetical protein
MKTTLPRVELFLTSVSLIFVVLAASGCVGRLNRPNIPAPLNYGSATAYTRDAFNTDYAVYKTDLRENRLTDARVHRDAMINRIEVDVEANYREFEAALASTRSGIDTGADVVELGLSAAIGVVGGTDVKDLLAASLTGFKGTRLSFDKNFFREKTTEAVISQMQAYRESMRNRITTKLSLDVIHYSFEEAWRDLVEYFYAGTLQAALQQLANEAGKAATAAKDKGAAIDVSRANTTAEAQAAVSIRQKYAELAALAHDPDTTKQESARKQLQEILSVLGEVEAAKSNDVDALLSALRSRIQHALTEPADIPLLERALTPTSP